MYITQLEIDNFKSFSKKTRIPVFEGFTVISGPNGSGKSNIIDSILFCLALSGARGLRAEKLTDLINLNSGKNTAEVAITFSDGTNIRRKIKRTARGYYSYNYLNDRLCKQSDVLEFLGRYGIKPEGYNVVMQGDITRIMEMSDGERRRIIDEIAGVAEFDKKRDQALGELEVVRERIEREELLLRELSLRLEELASEREQALKYRHWQDTLEFFRGCRSAAQLGEYERDHAQLFQLIDQRQRELGGIADRRASFEEEQRSLNEAIAAIDHEIDERSGTEYRRLISSIEEAKGDIRLAEQSIARDRQEKESNLETINRVYMDARRAETRVGECAESIRNLTIDRSNLAMELATMRAERETVDSRLQKESDKIAGAKEELFSLMGRAEEKRGVRSDLLHQQDILIEKSRIRTSERERLEARVTQISTEYEDKESQCAEYEQCSARIEEEKTALDRALSRTESNLLAHRSSLEKLKKEIRSKEQELMRLEAQNQASGAAGGRALEAVLGMEGVYGTIAQLGRAPPEYAVALNTAAGNRLNHVVVENDSVAAGAIAYLKANRLGRMTFLPLNKLNVPALGPLRDRDVVDYAVNLLEFDPMFEKAFALVFAGTVVIDTLEGARRKMGKFRMVTLEGDLVEKSGAMTGGSSQQKRSVGFGVAADEEISRVRVEIAGLEAEASDLESAIARLTEAGEEGRRQRSGLEEQRARYAMLREEYARRMVELEREKTEIQSSLESMRDEVRDGGEQLAELEEQLEIVSKELADLTSEIEDLKRKLDDTEIPALTEQLERLRREGEENERRLRNKEADIADMQRERQYFSKRIEELEEERTRIGDKNTALDEAISAAQLLIQENTERISDLERQQQEFSKELTELRKNRDLRAEDLKGIEHGIIEIDGEAERVRLQIGALQERAQTLADEIAQLREEVGDAKTDLSLNEIDAGMAEAEGEIRNLGAVNMLAIEEYERVCQRVSDRTEKKEILSKERTTLLERIEKFERMKYDAFMEAYSAIDENFRKIFARLTSGSGRLVLDNEEDPFSGGLTFAVQPRDKKVHLLSSLSGGEKSLTTLAFIFSIQQFMPAPFYALDEIDMFLDATNVERIGTLIKELSADAQSIIVSLRKPTIERADRIMGVTLRPDKSTYVTGVKSNA